MRNLLERLRTPMSFGLAGGIVLVDSASRMVSMVSDLIIVLLLLAVMLIGRKAK
jgi:nitrate reductase gamma subunit